MPRRTLYDPLQAIARPTWLVIRDAHRRPLQWRQIAAGMDLRIILKGAREERLGAGWACTPIGRADSVFFAQCAGERLQFGIERFDPAGPGAPSHSEPPAPA